jgi:hypothetical protein
MRARLAAALLAVISVAATSCSGPSAGVTGKANGYRVTCGDTPADADSIQHVIDGSRAHAAIEISGICLLTHGITLLANRSYTGDGRTATVLRQGAAMGYVLASAAFVHNESTTGAPISIGQLTVACSGHGRTDGIVILNWQADVRQVDVSNCGGSGIIDTSQTADGTSITNTSVNSWFSDNFISGSGAHGFQVIDNRNAVTDGHLMNNQIASSGGTAIELANAAGWNISGNHLYDDAGDGIVAQRLFGTVISGNYIEDFAGGQPGGTWYGIAGSAQDGAGSTIYGNNIFNNRGESGRAQHAYIAITGTNTGTGYVAVTGNAIHGAGRSDIGLSFTAGGHNLVVTSSGNLVTNVGTVIQHSGAVRSSAGA